MRALDRTYDPHTHHGPWAVVGWETICRMADDPCSWGYAPSGHARSQVVGVGMYDGWPFWEPTPAISYVGPLGAIEVAFYYELAPHKVGQP